MMLEERFPALFRISILLSLFLTSCVSYPKLDSPENPVTESNLNELAGVYQLSPHCDPFYLPIDHLVSSYSAIYGPVDSNEVLIGKLEVMDKRTLHLSVFRNGIYVSKHEIRGKIKKGYFALQQQSWTDKGDGPLILVPEYQKSLLGFSSDSSLSVSTRNNAYVQLFFLLVLGPDKMEILNHQIKRTDEALP